MVCVDVGVGCGATGNQCAARDHRGKAELGHNGDRICVETDPESSPVDVYERRPDAARRPGEDDAGAVGGGYSFDETKLTDMEKVVLYSFGKKIGLKGTIKAITKDIILHDRCYFHVELKGGKVFNVYRVAPEKVRINQTKTIYAVNEDWEYGLQIKTCLAFMCSSPLVWLQCSTH